MGIKTTVVGSYPVPAWLAAAPSRRALADATALVLRTQEDLGLDEVTDGELYRFDPDHPETNGMIDYFARRLGNVRTELTLEDRVEFEADPAMAFRARPAGVVTGPVTAGTLDLPADCRRARALARRPLRFTLTGPHMLAKTLTDRHHGSTRELCDAIAAVLAAQVGEIDADVVQIDEANVTGHPEEAPWALESLNRVLDAVRATPAVHLCFGNYGGQTVWRGTWDRLVPYLSGLRCDHVLVETTRRDRGELRALADTDASVRFGVGVIDVKSTVVEGPDEVAARIEEAVGILGEERVSRVNPDCGFWMLPREVADGKMRALVAGRDLFAGRSGG